MDKDPEWTISDAMMDYIFKLVPDGGTILELGSGYSTYVFDQCGYKVITVEQDQKYLNKVPNATYIYAPIELYSASYPQLNSIKKRINDHTGWYNRKAIIEGLAGRSYDCIVVDGPPRDFGRSGFYANLEFFNCNAVPVFFDDLHRLDDLFVAECVAQKLGRDLLITNNGEGKKPFGIVLV